MACKIVQGKIEKSTRKEVTIHFGDPNMPEKSKSKYGIKAFRARHNCDQKNDLFTPGYQACKVLW